MKAILFHVQDDAAVDTRVESALSLARTCGAHLSCLHVTPIEAYVLAAPYKFGDEVGMNSVAKALSDEELRLRVWVDEQLRSQDVPWDYVQVTGNVPTQIVRHAALADLIVVGREPHHDDFARPTVSLLGELLHRSKTPLFIPSADGGRVDPTGTAVVAWDAGYEAANAVTSSVGLLKFASDVRVIQVRESEKGEAFPGTRLLEYLSQHGINADLHVEQNCGGSRQAIAAALVSHARAMNASYIVMGGYSRSRLGQYLLGGVTQTLLGASPLPLLMAR